MEYVKVTHVDGIVIRETQDSCNYKPDPFDMYVDENTYLRDGDSHELWIAKNAFKAGMAITHELKANDETERSEGTWVSVEEELPEVEVEVLGFAPLVGCIVACHNGQVEGWYEAGTFGELTVTHWMPLPSPPEVK